MTPDFIDALQSKIQKSIRVALPGVIASYDFQKRLADVELFSERLADGSRLELPKLSGVPVISLISGGASVSMPIKSGDGCLIIFCDNDFRNWLTGNGKNSTPLTMRVHNLNDAIAIVGLNPPSSKVAGIKNNTDLNIQYEGSNITLKPKGVIEVLSAKEINIKSNQITINCKSAIVNVDNNIDIKCNTLNVDGNMNVTGDVVARGVSLINHVHKYVDSVGQAATPVIKDTQSPTGGAVNVQMAQGGSGSSANDDIYH